MSWLGSTAIIFIFSIIMIAVGFAMGLAFGEWLEKSRKKKRRQREKERDERAQDWDRLSGRSQF